MVGSGEGAGGSGKEEVGRLRLKREDSPTGALAAGGCRRLKRAGKIHPGLQYQRRNGDADFYVEYMLK